MTSFADLLKPEYKNEVAMNGNPTEAGAAFAAVYAAALANGGSLSNIAPGVAYYKLLRPGDQQVRSGPGRRPAMGGVPLLGHRPEPVAGG